MALELGLHHIDEGGVREAVLDGERTPRDTPAFLLRVPPSLQPCRSLPFAMLAGWPTPLRTTPRTSNGSEKLRPVACRMAAAVAAWGLVLVGSCPAAQSYGFFAPGRRSELQRSISSIQPKQGTPLADGVLKAGQLVDGVNKESTILVVSDGEESCEGNPCAVANALARSKPNLTINVVDILGTGAGNCLASATGGKVYTAKNADDVLKMATEAARDVLGPEHCIKPEANASPPP